MITEEHKVKSLIPRLMYDILASDCSKFNVRMNFLCNRIFARYLKEDIRRDDLPVKEKTLQFKLNKANTELFEAMRIEDHEKIENKSQLIRSMVWQYCDNPTYKRELIVYAEGKDIVELAIRKKRSLIISYRGEKRKIEPYGLLTDQDSSSNYIFSWCCRNGEYRNYRLSNVKPVTVTRELQQNRDEEYISSIRSDFDAFLSYGKRVEVEFTDEGKNLFENVKMLNRPRVIAANGNRYTLESSIMKAKVYFPAFMDEVEILAPEELRDYFTKKALDMAKIYRS